MLAYLPFPADWFIGAGLYHEDAKQFDTVVSSADEHVCAVKKVGAIAARIMIIATNKTQHNLEASPDEVREHFDLAKVAILAEVLRWTTQNQALRRQPRKGAVNLVTSRYVFTWKRNNDGSRYLKRGLTVRGFKDTAASNLDRFSRYHHSLGTTCCCCHRRSAAMAHGISGCVRSVPDRFYLWKSAGAQGRSSEKGVTDLTKEPSG